MDKLKLWIKIVIACIICLSIGFLSGFSIADSIGVWYADLNKPSFNPPSWVFAPTWSFFYVLMGVSVGLIWNEGLEKPKVKQSVILFSIHMIFNALWSIVFFGLQNPSLALAVIAFLWVLILACIIKFRGIKPLASWLLVPYLGWVSFAATLNFCIILLN